jgi:hypothetical protein
MNSVFCQRGNDLLQTEQHLEKHKKDNCQWEIIQQNLFWTDKQNFEVVGREVKLRPHTIHWARLPQALLSEGHEYKWKSQPYI